MAEVTASVTPEPEPATVWYSFTAGGHKVSFSGPHIAQVIGDIAGFFGEDAATSVLERLTEVFKASITRENAAAMGVAPVVADAMSPPAPPAPPGGYEQCKKCGSDKDKFVQSGISSRTGKPYNSFWGCGNTLCR